MIELWLSKVLSQNFETAVLFLKQEYNFKLCNIFNPNITEANRNFFSIKRKVNITIKSTSKKRDSDDLVCYQRRVYYLKTEITLASDNNVTVKNTQ
jgi:hypothetical protein